MLTWISDVFRSILSLFDRVVYWFLSLLVSLFDQIASVRVFGSDTIKAFSERIFFLVAVIMVFKVSFSIIKYIINPDTFSDNERGMGKVIRNVILVLVSLVCVQPFFQFSYDLQDRILKSQIIEKVILGVKIDGNTNGVSANEQKNVKDRIPFNLLTSFIRPNAEDIKELDLKPVAKDKNTTIDISNQKIEDLEDNKITIKASLDNSNEEYIINVKVNKKVQIDSSKETKTDTSYKGKWLILIIVLSLGLVVSIMLAKKSRK